MTRTNDFTPRRFFSAPTINEPAFSAGDRLWALDHIDPRFARDPLFDAPEEIDGARTDSKKRRQRSGGIAVALLAALFLNACSGNAPAVHAADAILIQLKAGVAAPALVHGDDSGPPIQPLTDLSPDGEQPLLRIPVPPGVPVENLMKEAAEDDGVEFAEPIYLYRANRTPNDPRVKDLWGLTHIEAPSAWDKTTGDRSVVVAVVDDGVALDHADLAPNLWTNPEEIAGNGKDDDGDGFVDDVHGYDFVDDDGTPSPAKAGDAPWHGTHVSGTIGAAGNNGVGVAGVNWKVSLMALRALGPDGGRADDLARAIDYAADHGARVINASWGGGGESKVLSKAIQRAGKRGVLFVAAAGNDAGKKPEFPAGLEFDNVISVGAIAPSGALASFSNRGALVAAPGVGILSTTAPGRYERYDGTSMASPHVAGIAALLWARHPKATAEQVREAILKSARPLKGAEHGAVSAARALATLDGTGGGAAELRLSRTELAFTAAPGRAPRTQVISIRTESGEPAAWKATADAAWIELPRSAGTTPSRLSVRVDPHRLNVGNHSGTVSIRPEGGEPASLTVTLQIGDAAPAAFASGPACGSDNGRLKIKAGTICRLTAPGLDPQARSVGVSWRLPGGARVPGGSFSARFVRPGRFTLRVAADDGEEEVPVEVE